MQANFLTTTGSQLAPRIEQHAENAPICQPKKIYDLQTIYPQCTFSSIKDFQDS